MRWGRWALCLVVLGGCSSVPAGPPVEIDIPPGSSLNAITDSLVAHQVIAGAVWFKTRGRLMGTDRHLQPGRYRFTPGEAHHAILDRLARGDALTIGVTLPEGATLWDFVRRTNQRLGLPADSIWAALRDTSVLRQYKIPGRSAEGWLLPETFLFGRYATPREVVRRFLAAREEEWTPEWEKRAEAAKLTRAQVVTLASIVEAEAQLPEELPLIAAVYRNRLRIAMPLQADPTIQYAFLVDSGTRKPRLFNRDYRYTSPYNSYLHPGLPPTPIGNPSAAAIEAVLSPAPVPSLYFVARGDGGHIFAGSYAEHLRNIRRVRR